MSSVTISDRTRTLERVVSRTRAGLVATAVAAGLFLAVAVAAGWVVGGIVLDLAAPLPVAGRMAVFAGWWACVAAAAAAFLFVPALRRPSLDTVAVLIERALGGMHNRLLTVIDLARGRRRDGSPARDAKPEMVERLVAQTTSRLEGFRPGRVIKGRTLARNLGIATLAAAILGGLWYSLGERFTITLARLLDPTADIPPATWLQLAAPGLLEVLEGEPLEIACDVTRGETEAVSLVLTSTDGTPARYPLRSIDAGRFTVTLDGLGADATYRLEGGNTWTKTFPITMLRRPVIEDVVTLVRLPAYMRIDDPLPVEPDALTIEAPFESAVEFRATVAGDVAEGGATLLERSIERRTVERIDERVWFEDDLPRDAVAATPWRWTTASAAGGLRAFTLDQTTGPATMRTRLEPLSIPREGLESKMLFVHAKVDPADPPRALAMTLDAEGRRLEVVWGDAAALPESGVKRLVAGSLPSSNDWTRLEAPLVGAATEITGKAAGGLTFRVDRGRVALDRPGWLTRGSETVDAPVDTPVGDVAAVRETDETWLTRVTVDGARLATIEFRSSKGHPSLPRPAVEIVPTVDRPPSLVVHEPQDTVVLEAPIDVEVVAEAFDDWGLDEIGFQSGPDAEHLGARTPLAGVVLADRPPDLRRDVRDMIRGDALGLAAGKTIAWRLYARDTKGQITDGPVRKISVARPPEHALADSQVPAAREAAREAKRAAEQAMQRKPSLEAEREKVLEAVGEEPLARIDDAQAAAQAAERVEQAAAEQAKRGNPEAKQAAEQAREEAKQQAAAETKEAQAATDEAVAEFEEPAKQALAAADAQLDAQRADAARLAEAVAKAAEQAKQSPLVRGAQAEALEALAERAAKLEQALTKEEQFAGETAKVERVADAPTSEAVAREAEAIGKAVEQVAEAVDAAGAAERLATLAEDLGGRAESLAALASAAREEAQATAEAGPSPAVEQPAGEEQAAGENPAGEQQAGEMAAEAGSAQGEPSPLEQAAREQLGQLDRILGTEEGAGEPAAGQPAGEASEPEASVPAGGQPASEPAAGEQSSGDQPGGEPAGQEPAGTDGAEPMQEQGSQPGGGEPAAGQPADDVPSGNEPPAGQEPAAGQPSGEAPSGGEPAAGQASGTESTDVEPAAGEPAPGTGVAEPSAQPPLGESLAAGAEDAREAAAQAAELAASLAEQAAAAAQGDSPAAAALAETLAGQPVQAALAMAERARALAAMQAAAKAAAAQAAASQQGQPGEQPGQQPGQPGTEPGQSGQEPGQQPGQQAGMPPPQGPAGRGPNVNDTPQTSPVGIADADRRGLDPAMRAAIEKLPPHVRDPLLEGMRQQGPEAYRGVIEAYFKRLGQEIPR